MRAGLLLAAVVITVMVAPVQAAVAPVVSSFDTSRLYTEEAAFAAAIKPYQDAIARNANNADAHFWLGVAYLHGWRLYKFGLAPFAAGYAGRAVASLERAVQLRPSPVAMVTLLEAYAAAGARSQYLDLFVRVGDLALPIPPK